MNPNLIGALHQALDYLDRYKRLEDHRRTRPKLPVGCFYADELGNHLAKAAALSGVLNPDASLLQGEVWDAARTGKLKVFSPTGILCSPDKVDAERDYTVTVANLDAWLSVAEAPYRLGSAAVRSDGGPVAPAGSVVWVSLLYEHLAEIESLGKGERRSTAKDAQRFLLGLGHRQVLRPSSTRDALTYRDESGASHGVTMKTVSNKLSEARKAAKRTGS